MSGYTINNRVSNYKKVIEHLKRKGPLSIEVSETEVSLNKEVKKHAIKFKAPSSVEFECYYDEAFKFSSSGSFGQVDLSCILGIGSDATISALSNINNKKFDQTSSIACGSKSLVAAIKSVPLVYQDFLSMAGGEPKVNGTPKRSYDISEHLEEPQVAEHFFQSILSLLVVQGYLPCFPLHYGSYCTGRYPGFNPNMQLFRASPESQDIKSLQKYFESPLEPPTSVFTAKKENQKMTAGSLVVHYNAQRGSFPSSFYMVSEWINGGGAENWLVDQRSEYSPLGFYVAYKSPKSATTSGETMGLIAVEMVRSMLLRVTAGLYVLDEHLGACHGDMQLGNILCFKEPVDDQLNRLEYDTYIYRDRQGNVKEVRVPILGASFVINDPGRMWIEGKVMNRGSIRYVKGRDTTKFQMHDEMAWLARSRHKITHKIKDSYLKGIDVSLLCVSMMESLDRYKNINEVTKKEEDIVSPLSGMYNDKSLGDESWKRTKELVSSYSEGTDVTSKEFFWQLTEIYSERTSDLFKLAKKTEERGRYDLTVPPTFGNVDLDRWLLSKQ